MLINNKTGKGRLRGRRSLICGGVLLLGTGYLLFGDLLTVQQPTMPADAAPPLPVPTRNTEIVGIDDAAAPNIAIRNITDYDASLAPTMAADKRSGKITSRSQRSVMSGTDVIRLVLNGSVSERVYDQPEARPDEPAVRPGFGEISQRREAAFSKSEVKALLPHLGLILSESDPQLEMEGWNVIGVKLADVQNASLLKQLGFESGDTIVSVNGKGVFDPYQILTELHSGRTDAYLDFRRNGELMRLRVFNSDG